METVLGKIQKFKKEKSLLYVLLTRESWNLEIFQEFT